MAIIKVKNVKEIPKVRPFKKRSTNNLYFQDESNIVKIFLECYRPLNQRTGRDVYKMLTFLMNLEGSTNLVLPKNIYVNSEEIIGYSTTFLNAPSISYISRDTKLIDLLNAYKKVLEDLKLLSENSVNLLDVNEGSILYKDGSLYLLDFDLSEFNNIATKNSIYTYNAYKIWQQILRSIFINVSPYSLYDITNHLHLRDFDRGALGCGIISIEESLDNFYLSMQNSLAIDNKTCLNDIDLKLRRIKDGY